MRVPPDASCTVSIELESTQMVSGSGTKVRAALVGNYESDRVLDC